MVPRGSATLGEILEQLTPELWAAWTEGLQDDTLPMTMPRFELDLKTDLEPPLTRMGMGLAFDAGADFSDLAQGGGFIDRAEHRTLVKVDEVGTEAAAATALTIPVSGGFQVDRPFMVAIRERFSGAILFLGAVYDPR